MFCQNIIIDTADDYVFRISLTVPSRLSTNYKPILEIVQQIAC